VLASIYIEGPDGSRFDPFGANPTGILIMDGNGRISVQFIDSDLPKFASDDRLEGTSEENKAVQHGILCYFGTYSVSDADHSNIHIESSSFPNWKGADQKRFLTLTEDEMKWINPTSRFGSLIEPMIRPVSFQAPLHQCVKAILLKHNPAHQNHYGRKQIREYEAR
jgi:Lipocalin-like domain